MNRDEHIEHCKKTALEVLETGSIQDAIASMGSDLSKHPETKNSAGQELCAMFILAGLINTKDEAKKFILGFR
jgi:hypothetical protein